MELWRGGRGSAGIFIPRISGHPVNHTGRGVAVEDQASGVGLASDAACLPRQRPASRGIWDRSGCDSGGGLDCRCPDIRSFIRSVSPSVTCSSAAAEVGRAAGMAPPGWPPFGAPGQRPETSTACAVMPPSTAASAIGWLPALAGWAGGDRARTPADRASRRGRTRTACPPAPRRSCPAAGTCTARPGRR